jgi:hypothetical protein
MPKGDKYVALKYYLKKSNQPIVKLTFEQIEKIINDSLPDSASKYGESWWSNNADHSQAVSWLEAGYETDYVTDTYKGKNIVFVKRD